jgi:hypothetical protein
MNLSGRARRTTTMLGLLFTASVAPLAAQDLPAAEDVLARYRTAMGGEAYAKVQSMHSVGEFAIPAMGVTASFDAYAVRPNQSVAKVTIPGFGDFHTGYTGDVAWALDPVEGPRLLKGGEAKQMADGALFDSTLRPTDMLESATTVERTKLAGRDCLKLRVVWKSGRETFDCFSEESGLLVASQEQSETSMGMVETIAVYDDYRDFNGLKVAGRTTVQQMGVERIITIRDVHFDNVPASVLEPPAQIRTLISNR